MAFRWRVDDGPFKKNVNKFEPPLTKLSGSAHEQLLFFPIMMS